MRLTVVRGWLAIWIAALGACGSGGSEDPYIGVIPDLTNSAITLKTIHPLELRGFDWESLTLNVQVANPEVARARVDFGRSALILEPLRLGATLVTVNAGDGSANLSREFTFDVREVTREVRLTADAPDSAAVSIVNESDRPMDFVLEHNERPLFESLDKIVEYVHSMKEEMPGESFGRKLWRFLRDSTAHYYPLMPLQFRSSPWGVLNSIGFGFCGDVSTAFVAIARAAGYEARVWSLFLHVVPEIREDERWKLFDPDLAVYYYNRQGKIAGVEELAADPLLITNPIDPFLRPGAVAYSQYVSGIYGSMENNAIASDILMPSEEEQTRNGRIVLPPGGRFTYPGRWTDAPAAYVAFGEIILDESLLPNWRNIAFDYDGATPYPAPFHRQARLDLPLGWAGTVEAPLWVWDIQGTGRVSVGGIEYDVGSAELTEQLRYRMPVRTIEVLESQQIALVMQINMVDFGMRPFNMIRATGKDVWAITTELVDLGSAGAGEPWINNRELPLAVTDD